MRVNEVLHYLFRRPSISSLHSTYLLGTVTVEFHTTGKREEDWIRQDLMLIYEIDTLMRVWKYLFPPVFWFLWCDKSNIASELFVG